ncbi:MAG: hypothetical protein JO079_05725 [Frankiaceae bacterium]|nr:hypothetical protein [Frankiaceae bacterium]MBV9368381.1 hypothetical protein [Frankiales bacterium]
MRHCDGRLFDGSACNNDLFDCAGCGATGCVGDGCDNQSFTAMTCCGAELGTERTLASAAA